MEKFMTRYSQTYILIGQLELILRARLIETLSRYSLEKGYTEWHEVLDAKSAHDPSKPYVSFGVWRDVLSQRNFTKLWLPCTRYAFIDLAFFANARNVKHEEANLRWLIRALGEKTVAIVEPSA